MSLSDSERAALLAGVEGLIVSLARKAGGSEDDKEDRAQSLRLLAWELTARFDPARGCKFSTYFHRAADRQIAAELVRAKNRQELLSDRPKEFDAIPDPRSLADPDPEPDTDAELFAAVRAALAAGLLAKLTPLEREICELVSEGVPLASIVERVGRSRKDVRLIMRNAHRRLTRKPAAVA